MIMGFLFLIFFISPVGGGAIATGLLSLFPLIEGGAAVGAAVYSVVYDPDNAFMTDFSTLLGAGFSRGGFQNAANSGA
ncbi:glycosyl hydrolase family 18 [Colletotrichum orchidophilum]|uniref:Glycosyl hydrolase family 18 n=1 Tax=Colletotrichum orchidophilum TaxID=1209926 RepID=A0A1G4BR06_9PEZI|nr:glycosyl hydrolase family 18 [Colletotrichum orchidophilum]OHF03717.1 glycosyl hydrolase family 18 [Colletotrichum orchidophilum]